MWLKYSNAPILNGEQYNRQQSADPHKYSKPNGFWITDDSDDCWRRWCVGERFGLEQLTHKHEIVLDESNLLILRSAYDIHLFTRTFGREKWWGPDGHPNKWRDRCIDWPEVAARYSGLIITPYQWSCRMGEYTSWYYGWDCASGCVWDASAILGIHLLEIDHEVAKLREAEAA